MRRRQRGREAFDAFSIKQKRGVWKTHQCGQSRTHRGYNWCLRNLTVFCDNFKMTLTIGCLSYGLHGRWR